MNLLITGHHVDVTPALRAYVEDKLERITRHFDQIIDIAVVLGVEKPSEKEKAASCIPKIARKICMRQSTA